jgi:hypothetical protein
MQGEAMPGMTFGQMFAAPNTMGDLVIPKLPQMQK